MNIIQWDDFAKLDIRVGTVVSCEFFAEARKPAYKMTLDFGKLGRLKTSAQIVRLYQPEDLIGKQLVAVVNLAPKQIANTISECLVLGAVEDDGKVVVLQPERTVKNGTGIG